MPKTHKVQVTLDDDQYERLCDIAEREGKSLAGVVRESVVRYSLEPAERRRRQKALQTLTGIEAPVPEEYGEWEGEYSRWKVDRASSIGDPAGAAGSPEGEDGS